MSFDEIQYEGAGMDVSHHPKQERQVPLSEGLACEVNYADDGATSPDVGTSQDTPRAPGQDVAHELPADSTNICRTAPVEPMTPSGVEPKVLQPSSTSGCMVGVSNQVEYQSIDQTLVLILDHLEALTKLTAALVVGRHASPPEEEIDPDGLTIAEPETPSTVSAPSRRTWKWCPDIVPYVQQGTRQKPLSVLDLQQTIRDKTGNLHSIPSICTRIRPLAQEGKIDLYAMDHDGNLIPCPARRAMQKLYIVWRGASQPASLLPNPAETSPEPGGGGPIGEMTLDGLAPPSAHAATLVAAPVQVPGAATLGVSPPPKGLARWLRQFGIRKSNIQTGC